MKFLREVLHDRVTACDGCPPDLAWQLRSRPVRRGRCGEPARRGLTVDARAELEAVGVTFSPVVNHPVAGSI